MRRSQSRQRAFELECFVHCFADERLDDVLPPGSEGTATKAPAKTLDPREPDSRNLRRIAVEHDDTRVDEDLPNLVAFAGFEVMVPHHGDARHAERRRDLAGEHTSFFR